jgi:protein SCO1/2
MTSEDEIAALVADVKRHPERRDSLVELLPERHRLYSGRSSNAVVLLRGYLIAAFEDVGLPNSAYRYVLDDLQNSREAYLVAAAAMAVRGLANPGEDVVRFLLAAIRNIQYHDDHVTFATFPPRWPADTQTTAMAEIVKTLAWLGDLAQPARADLEQLVAEEHAVGADTRALLQNILIRLKPVDSCCHSEQRTVRCVPTPAHRGGDGRVPAGIRLEDQDGHTLFTDEFFSGLPSIVTFFYTRCDNPNKCSLTITKIARLQRILRADSLTGRIKIAAISYDPSYDIPSRLHAYGVNRGVVFGDNCRFLRTCSRFDELERFFELGVNYGPAVVNRHQIELFILDSQGRICTSFTRLQWDPEEALSHARSLTGAVSP